MLRKLLIINLVGLTRRELSRMPRLASLFADRGQQIPLLPPLPALTCSSQATITTGSLPGQHGIVSNGWYFRESGEVRFWMRSDRLVGGEKIWESARRQHPEVRTANLFWRYTTHSSCDVTVTERPTYWANGRKSPDIYCSPPTLRDELVKQLGEFPLFRFWGPATGIQSTQWIADATRAVLRSHDPHLALTYLPHLDYDLQKFGPTSPQALAAVEEVDTVASQLIEQAQKTGRDIAVLSEYGITAVSRPVYLNRILRQAGYVAVQAAKNGELLEPAACRAFASCSHQVAHIYVARPDDVAPVRELLESTDGVDQVLGESQKKSAGLDHPRSGELVAVASRDAWFAYPYWIDDSLAPDLARCVAIHDKPGHDPVEMFLGPGGKPRVIRRVLQNKLGLRVPFDVISTDARQIRGSHGRIPETADERPLLLTSWSTPAGETGQGLPMQDVKALLLQQLAGRSPDPNELA